MPRRSSVPPGGPAWIDLLTDDIEGASAFYTELFGWSYEGGGPEYGGYRTAMRNGLPVAGLMPGADDVACNQWRVYLAVTDAAAVTDRVVSEGGRVVQPPLELPGLGTFALFSDPPGAQIAAWQEGGLMGFALSDEPGTPTWFEVHTPDFLASRTFYERVFGWQMTMLSDTDEFRYAQNTAGDIELSGIMDATSYQSEPLPARWHVYFKVTDADGACALIEEQSGRIISPPEDTEFGRIAAVTDPWGTEFRIASD